MFLLKSNLQHLTDRSSDGKKLSIYIPTHPASSSSTLTEDTVRFKNALQAIKSDAQYDEQELGETIQQLELLLHDVDFWKHRLLSLAVFADKNGYEVFNLGHEITEMQYIQNTFVVSPLAIMLSIDTGYYVLDINHKKPRLAHFTSGSRVEIAVHGMPGSFEDTAAREKHRKQLQHQSMAGDVFHGHNETAALDEDIIRYYKLIAKSVNKYLANHDEPLLLAGTQDRVGHMRQLLKYPNVLDVSLEGSNEALNLQELQNVTKAIIDTYESAKRDTLITQLTNEPPGTIAIGHVEIEKALDEGRVASLFLSVYKVTTDNVRDTYKSLVVLQLPDDIQSMEKLVRGALSQGGTIIAVEVGTFEDDSPRALCRF
jgi:hypothetical protein